MNNKSLEEQVKEAIECCKGRKCEGCQFNGVSACCVTVLLHIQHATATFEKDGHHLRCSNCGEYFCSKDCEGNMFPQKYCPNCGAKMELLKERDAVVRCLDCKWWHESMSEKGFGYCGQANGLTLKPSHWFCADGKPKD